jgi:hypothetical protein
MSKELLKMQKLAGIITESQYKEKLNETDSNLGDLLTPDDLHKFLHTLRNSINTGDKKAPLDMVNKAISSIADKLTEGINDTADSIKYSYDDMRDAFHEGMHIGRTTSYSEPSEEKFLKFMASKGLN